MVIRLEKYSSLILIFFTMIILSEIRYVKIPFVAYVEEVICIYFLCVMILMIFKKSNFLKYNSKVMILLMAITLLLGITSNAFSGIADNWFIVCVDIVANYKGLIIFIFLYNTVSVTCAKILIKKSYIIAKTFLILAVGGGIVSLFFDLGMGGEIRYGISSYSFIFTQAHVFSVLTKLALVSIVANTDKKNEVLLFTIISVVCEVLTTKGPSLIWIFVITFLYFYYVYNRRINMIGFGLIAVFSLWIGRFQIERYILDVTSPRMQLLIHGIETSNSYFPLGSGFATYGSDMAAKNYSPLYEKYGFNSFYGMSESWGGYLNDNYWPMLMAQGGYLAGMIWIIIYYILYVFIQNGVKRTLLKANVIALFIYMLMHSVGSAIFTSGIGVMALSLIAIIIKAEEQI